MATQPGYGPSSYPPPPESSSSTVIWIVVLVLALVIGLPILAVAVMFLGWHTAVSPSPRASDSRSTSPARTGRSNDPVIQQHIGEIQSATLNFADTAAEQQKQQPGQGAPAATVMVIDVRGTKGSGQIVGHQEPGNPPGKFFTKATLRTSQGEFPLSP